MEEKKELEDKQELTKARLERAHKLTGGLGSEAVRWSSAAEQLRKDRENLVGNIILSAGCVAYLGPFTAEYRAEMLNSWVGQCKTFGIPVDP